MGILKVTEDRKMFNRDWNNYILSFEDIDIEKDEFSSSDKDLEAWYCGCDMSKPFISTRDKIKVKRYRRDDCKR